MGNKPGKECSLTKKQIKEFVKETHFNEDEIQGLDAFFQEISSTGQKDGFIDRGEFQTALGFKESLYVDRMFQIFDTDGNSAISFSEFSHGLSFFSTKGTIRDKTDFSFQIYDVDGDGKISPKELQNMLETSLKENGMKLTAGQVQVLLDETFAQVDTNKDGFIDMAEYRAYVESNPQVISHMNVNVAQKISMMRKQAESRAAATEGKRG